MQDKCHVRFSYWTLKYIPKDYHSYNNKRNNEVVFDENMVFLKNFII